MTFTDRTLITLYSLLPDKGSKEYILLYIYIIKLQKRGSSVS
nr:MAG TPA: hypothetical protein [Caudoviricetes sp.]